MSDSIWVFIFSRSGRTIFGASALMGPSGMPSSACWMILTDSRISSCGRVAAPRRRSVRGRHVELELLVAGVGHVAAEIEVDAGGAQRRPGDAEGDGVFGERWPTPLQAVPKMGLPVSRLVLVDLLGEGLEEGLDRSKKSSGGSMARPPMRK
jgi:hypothetical protein